MNAQEAVILVAKTKFETMDQLDHQAFCGVESDDALIGDADGYTIILDGDLICFVNQESGEERQFAVCELFA